MIRTVSVKSTTAITGYDVAIVPIFAKRPLGAAARKLDRASRSAISGAIKAGRASARRGTTFIITPARASGPGAICCVGMGKFSALDATASAEAGGQAANILETARYRSAALLVEGMDDDEAARLAGSFTKGFTLALYRYRVTAEKQRPVSLKRFGVLTDADRAVVKRSTGRAVVVSRMASQVRDLVNAPANILTPSAFEKEARALAREYGVGFEVARRTELEKKNVGGLLAVGFGSEEDPRMITVHYNRGKGLPQVCLVGKGVTFDTGGISLKPSDRMNEMKGDMAGAAVVLCAVCAAASLDIPLEIVGVMPVVENMPDGRAFRPGDVLTTYSGKTVEVLSTDAEGRLILADALTWVHKLYRPIVTVDFATLTGAVLVALGTRIAGVMGNSQPDVDDLIAAGAACGEPTWQLPLDEPFYEEVRGEVSDLKNYSGRNGSTITAAALLGHFVGKRPWAHVDIAGTFWKGTSGASWHTPGATGYGVDLTLSFLERVAAR